MLVNEKTVPLNRENKSLNWKQFSKAFLDASPSGIVVTDRSFKTAISNRKAQAHLDIFTGTLINTTIPELVEDSKAVLRNKSSIRDIEVIRHDKKFLTLISPILWENHSGASLFFPGHHHIGKAQQKNEILPGNVY